MEAVQHLLAKILRPHGRRSEHEQREPYPRVDWAQAGPGLEGSSRKSVSLHDVSLPILASRASTAAPGDSESGVRRKRQGASVFSREILPRGVVGGSGQRTNKYDINQIGRAHV